MDKSYINCKEERVCVERCSSQGVALILSILACICISFTLMNATLRLYSSEESHGKLSEAVIAMSEQITENEAVAAFLGLEGNESAQIY